MPYSHEGPNASATFGNYNDINETQNIFTNITNVQNNTVKNKKVYKRTPKSHQNLKRDLRDILNPSDFVGNTRFCCLENTRKQTLQSIDEWVNTGQYPNVLLLIGAAGTGKSTIATTVARQYQKRGQIGCHMFFVRGSSDPRNVLESIAYSLSAYSQTIAESLVDQLKDKGNLGPSDLKTKFDILLREPLYTTATKAREPILIVLDALDECGAPKARQSLINVLRDGLPTLPPNFRFIITSRPENDILSAFTSLQHPKAEKFDLDLRVEESKLDVFKYIKYELEELRSSRILRVPQSWAWDESIQSLADIADGLFIWASTAIKLISEQQFDRFNSLVELAKNGKKVNLNDLYATILENAFGWDEGLKEIFFGVFSFVLFSKSPLSDEAINGVLGRDVAPDILMSLRSLVIYDPGNPITIRHASFYDYLVSCKEMPWYIDPEVQKAYIASKCLERMGDSLRYNICNIPSSFVFNTDVPDIDNLVTRYIPPFLKYICCNWVYHLQDVPYSQELYCQLQSFVYNQLLFWFEVLSLTNTFNDHVGPTLLLAIHWVGNNDPELSSFLRDAYRQAVTYLEPISKSVLQIYTSLLPLTKEESLMSIHYSKYANDAFRVEYVGTKPRSNCIKTIQVRDGYEPIDFLLFSPDGTRILSNSERGLCVWDATSGELIAGPLAENDGSNVLSAAYSLDGRCIIDVSTKGIIRKWDIFTGCLVWGRVMVEGQINLTWVTSALFSPDRKSIVFGDTLGMIRVWNVDTGEQDGEPLEEHISSVNHLSFSSDGRYLASGSSDATILIWDMDKRELKTGWFKKRGCRMTAVTLSPNGNNVVSSSSDGYIYVQDVDSGKILRKIKCVNTVYSVVYSPNGLFLLGCGAWWIRMWDMADDMAEEKVLEAAGYIYQISFSPDGSRFVSGSRWVALIRDVNSAIQVWDASWSVEEPKSTFEEDKQVWISSIALSPGGKFIASGLYKGGIYLWSVLSGELVKKLELSRGVISVSFSPINEYLIAFVSWLSGTVQVWDVTNDVVVTIGNHEDSTRSIAFSPDGMHVASGSEDKTICIWNVESRKLAVGPLAGHKERVLEVAYSQNGKRLVSGSYDNTVRVWNSETGELLSTLIEKSYPLWSVACSLDGSRIVSRSDDKTIRVWDVESDRIVCREITGHEELVTSVSLSLDGKRILSGSYDNIACVWDADTGELLFSLFNGRASRVESGLFFPDGRHFATGSTEGVIRIWTLDEIPNDNNWELKVDNWVVGKDGKLMMWIPSNLHEYLYHARNTRIINSSFHFKLHFGTK